MTNPSPESEPQEPALLRLITLVLGGIEVVLFTLLANLLLHAADPADAVEAGLAIVLPLVGLTLPGIILSWLGRAPWTALALVALALPVAGLAWWSAQVALPF